MLAIHEKKTVTCTFAAPLPKWAEGVVAVIAGVPFGTPGDYRILGQAYKKRDDNPRVPACYLCEGHSKGHPFDFKLKSIPLLEPGAAEPHDALGCGDPSRFVGPHGEEIIFYSQARLMPERDLQARGRSAGNLGVLIALGALYKDEDHQRKIYTIVEPTEQFWWHKKIDLCREGEMMVNPDNKRRHLFFEFADKDASHIAVVEDFRFSRVTSAKLWLDIRPGKWDSAHVSTGPIIRLADGNMIMFYNGCNGDKVWAIGEVVFDPNTLEVSYRSDQPIIEPSDAEKDWDDHCSAFSSGVLETADKKVMLFYHQARREMICATGEISAH